MKKFAHILSILILFQSCYSYKPFELKEFTTIRQKKVKIELYNSTKTIKGEIVSIKNDTLFLKKHKSMIIIPIIKIENIKQKEHSKLKTTMLSIGLGITVFTIVLIESLKSSFDKKEWDFNWK